ERNAAGVGGGDDAFALAVLLQFAARGLDVGADLRDLPVEKIAGLLDRLELFLVVEPDERVADSFSDFLREARRGGDIADVHERGAAHRNDFERTDDRAGHLRTDLRDLRRRLAVDPGRIKLRIAQQLLVFDDLLAEPAALQK